MINGKKSKSLEMPREKRRFVMNGSPCMRGSVDIIIIMYYRVEETIMLLSVKHRRVRTLV